MSLKRIIALLLALMLASFAALAEAELPAGEEAVEETVEEAAEEAAGETPEDLEAYIAELEAQVELYKPYYDAQVIVEYDGGAIFKDEILEQYEYIHSQVAQSYGIDLDAYGLGGQYKQMIAEDLLTRAVKQIKAEEYGIGPDEETLAELAEEAKANFETYITSISQSLPTEDLTEEEIRQQAIEALEGYGITEEYLYQSLVEPELDNAITLYITGDITIGEDEIQEAYDAKVTEQQEKYEGDDRAYNTDRMDGEAIVWNPEGYRAVKHALIKFDSDQSARYSDITSRISALNAEMEAATAPVEEAEEDEAEDEAEEAVEEVAEEAAEEIAETAEDVVEEAAEEAAAEEAAEEIAEEVEEEVEEEIIGDVEEEVEEEVEEALPEADDAEETPDEEEAPRPVEEIQADLDAANAELDALYAELMPKAEELIAKFNEGTPFADLIAEYNEDPGMVNEPTATDGYAVSEDSVTWDPAFTEGAMSIEAVGGISEPVKGMNGIHVIYYESDIVPGAVAFEDVHDAIAEEALQAKRDGVYDATIDEWTASLNPVTHYERLD